MPEREVSSHLLPLLPPQAGQKENWKALRRQWLFEMPVSIWYDYSWIQAANKLCNWLLIIISSIYNMLKKKGSRYEE
ncbi:hypothetical protein KDW_29900 [Dictyobacter vulcani]|uniref:Uncharacterized protein n=1 Tax=Dictyobacter vulcani TaxID=2607529 RepID=A0A5J4KGP3_9CHLR|nr:hypothetical protein KDW_29900 [Dictyobacter vulcani]